MSDEEKTRDELLAEVRALRARVAELEGAAAEPSDDERYQSYFEHAPDAMFIADERGVYVEVNPAACRITGYSEDELVGMRLTDLVDEDEREQAMRHFARLSQGENPNGRSTAFRRKDGTLGFFSVTAVKLSETRSLGFVRDVSEQRAAEQALRRSEEKFRKIFNNRGIIMAITSIDEGRYIEVNDCSVETTGFDREQALGATSVELIKDLYDRTVETKEKVSVEHATPVRGEERWWLSTISPLIDESGRVWRLVGTALDVTDRHRVEQELEDQRALYTALFEASPTAILVLQSDRYILVNPAGAAMLGYDHPDEVMGVPAMESIAAEEALRESEARYRTLFHTAPDAIFVADATTGFIRLGGGRRHHLHGAPPRGHHVGATRGDVVAAPDPAHRW